MMVYDTVTLIPLVMRGASNEENDFVLAHQEVFDQFKKLFNLNPSRDHKNFDVNIFSDLGIKSIGVISNPEDLNKFLEEKIHVNNSVTKELQNKFDQGQEGLFLIIMKDENTFSTLFLQVLLLKNCGELIENNSRQLLVFLKIVTKFNKDILLLLNQNEIDLMKPRTKKIMRMKIVENKSTISELSIERQTNFDLNLKNTFDKFTFIQSTSDQVAFVCTKQSNFYEKFEINCDDLSKFIESMNNTVGVIIKLNINDLDGYILGDCISSSEDITEDEINQERYRRNVYIILHAFSKLFSDEYKFLLKLIEHLERLIEESDKKLIIIFKDYLKVEKLIKVNFEQSDIHHIEDLVKSYIDNNKILEIHKQAIHELLIENYNDPEEKKKLVDKVENLNGKDRNTFLFDSKFKNSKNNVINDKLSSMNLNALKARVIFVDLFKRINEIINTLNNDSKYEKGFDYTSEGSIKVNLKERRIIENYIKRLGLTEHENNLNNIIIQGILKQKDKKKFHLLCKFNKAIRRHNVYALELTQKSHNLIRNFDTKLSEKSDFYLIDNVYLLHVNNFYELKFNNLLEKRLSVSLLATKGANISDKFNSFGKPYIKSEFYHPKKLLAILFNNENSLSISTYKIITNKNNYHWFEKDHSYNVALFESTEKLDEKFFNNIQVKFEMSNPILWIRIKEILYSVGCNTASKKKIDLSESNPNSSLSYVFDSSQFITQDDLHIYNVVRTSEDEPKITKIKKSESGYYHITTIVENNQTFLYMMNFNESDCKINLFRSAKIKNDKTSQYMINNTVQINGDQNVKETILGSIISSFKTYPIQSALEIERDEIYVTFNKINIVKMSETNMEIEQINNYFKQKLNELVETNKANECMTTRDVKLNFYFYKEFDNGTFEAIIDNANEFRLNEWYMLYLTILPLKILKLENNEVKLIQNNKVYEIEENKKVDSTQLSNEITFDFLEDIINTWNKEVKVVTIMGKQSTGKSYFINHLFGTMFTSSAKRCTAGCWISLKITDECLYIVIDFEAFGTLERTCQEDAILTLINYAVGNICLFKTEKAGVDREIERLILDTHYQYSKMEWQPCNDIFQGKLIFVINDVNEDDEKTAIESFFEQINNAKSKITGSLVSEIEIWPSPLFHTNRYQSSLIQFIKDCIKIGEDNIQRNTLNNSYKKGRIFLDNFKILIASMVVQNFTSFDKQKYEKTLIYVQENLEKALHNGKTSDGSKLFIRSTYEEINDKITITLSNNTSFEIKDTDNDFGSEFYDNIQKLFLDKLGHEDIISMQEFHKMFNDEVLIPLIEFRKNKCDIWIKENLNFDFEECKIESDKLRNKINIWSKKYYSLFKVCTAKCENCYGICILNAAHTEKHNCGTNHKCKEICSYGCNKACFKSMCHENEYINVIDLHKCEDVHQCLEPCKYYEKSKCNKSCKFEKNHGDNHVCDEEQHFCREKCKFYSDSSYKCEEDCWLLPDEYHDDHKCNKKYHVCNHKCSLPTCDEICDVRDKLNHKVHKCDTRKNAKNCKEKCQMQGCKNFCCFPDHFHLFSDLFKEYNKENDIEFGLEELGINNYENKYEKHMCDKDHDCYEDCNEPGYCDQKMLITRDSNNYDNVKRGSEGIKKKCSIKIPKFKEAHVENNHSCNATIHNCKVKCPMCNKLCNLCVNHDGLHDTLHTNRNISYESAENSSVASLMCDIYCNEKGRGHLHIVQTNNEEEINEIENLNGKKLQDLDQTQLNLNNLRINAPFDSTFYVLNHSSFWNYIKFNDPCTHRNLSKCNHKCPSTHEQTSFCILDKFHNLETNTSNHEGCYVSRDGHVFQCKEPKCHFYFCVDDSGSMYKDDRRKITINAIKNFLNSRKSETFNDLITFINFSSDTKIELEKVSIDACLSFILDSKDELAGMRSWYTHGPYRTKLSACITEINQLLRDNFREEIENSHFVVVITDGEIHDKDKALEQIKTDIIEVCKIASLYLMFIEDKQNLTKLESNELIETEKDYRIVRISILDELVNQFQLLSQRNEIII